MQASNNLSIGHEFTQAEIRLLKGLVLGASNKQMASELEKSEFTVRNQLSALFKKMSVSNRTHAASWFRERRERKDHQGQPFGTSVPLPGKLEARKI